MNVSLSKLSLSRVTTHSPFLPIRKTHLHVSSSRLDTFFKPFMHLMSHTKVQKCHFSRFVDKAIVFEANYEGFTASSRKYNFSEVTIQNTWFDSVQSSSNGSAIETKSYCIITIKTCVFSNMYSPLEGGAVYLVGPISNISKCCFYRCFCGQLGNAEKGGNAFSAIGDCTVEFCHATECAPNISCGGDSLYHLFNGLHYVSEFNGTRNYAPYHGGLGGAFHNQNPNSTLSFSTFSNSSDHNFFESWDSTATV